jgi:alcohol dehydrogenase (cytochrome c)
VTKLEIHPLNGLVRNCRRGVVGVFMLAVSTLALAIEIDEPPASPGPSYTEAQASAGKEVYTAKCSACHGASLAGVEGPALAGPPFSARWETGRRTVEDLFDKIQSSMPFGAGGSLSNEQYLNIVAYILRSNGHNTGSVPLAAGNLNVLLTPPDGVKPPSAQRPVLPMEPKNVSVASTASPDAAELLRPDEADWLMYNKDFGGHRYSKLDQITVSNAGTLEPVCTFRAGETGSFENAPVVYRGVMYITTPYTTFALNARTCATIWTYRYPEDRGIPLALCRGSALYRGKLFRVTPNGHLIAIDAKTGQLLWDVWMSDKERGYWLSAAPVIFDGKVFMGTAGADAGAKGFIEAFDAATGKHIWTFDTIPTGKQMGADTWEKGSDLGGGSFWTTFSVDPGKGLLYASIGNPAPDFNGALRPGDNLFTNAVVALQARTGKIAWWAQQIPHDTHDWDTAAAPTLYEYDGHKFLAVANKGGWLYIYDRDTHKLVAKTEISPHVDDDLPLTVAGTHFCPGTSGGANWNGTGYSPVNRVLYINTVSWCVTARLDEHPRYLAGATYFGGSYTDDPMETARGYTKAFDASTGKEIWSHEFPAPMVAAVTPTAGGVIFTGSMKGEFLVLDAKDGHTLYSNGTDGAVASAPSTYSIDGKQYVAVAHGHRSRTHWLTGGEMSVTVFALPGTSEPHVAAQARQPDTCQPNC